MYRLVDFFLHVFSTNFSFSGSDDGPDNEDGLDGGVIAAIICSVLVFGGIIAAIAWYLKRR